MKYPQLSAAVPQGEHFDDSVVNEGVWLTVAHLNNIEQALSTTAFSAEKVTEMEVQIDSLVNTAVKDAATIRTQSARIVELEALPSGNGSKLIAGAKDESAEEGGANEGKLPRYDDPEHPGNKSARMFVRARK